MNKYLRYALPLALATLVMAGCKDDETVEVGEWNSTSDFAVVWFDEINESVELDPADETKYTLTMTRRDPALSAEIKAEQDRIFAQVDALKKEMEKKLKDETLTEEQAKTIEEDYETMIDALEEQYDAFVSTKCDANLAAIEVPITITGGDKEIFTISSAKFEQGKWVGEYTISFPEAELGKPYSVQYAVTDPRFVSAYSDAATATFTVSRVKWVSVGKADFHDYYYFEDNNEVEVLMKDGDPTKFRIMHPYDVMLTGAQTVESSPYTELTLLKTGEVLEGVKITEPDLVYFTAIHTGYVNSNYGKEVVAWHPADLYASPSEDLFLSSYVLGYQKKTIEGKEYTIPGAINLAPYFYMSGLGGWNATSVDPCIRIIFDGFKLNYEANLFTEGDFEWEEVFEGVFTSGQLKTSSTAKLFKGKCVVTTDDADKRFAEAYGTPYYIEAPYAEDYDIYFFVKDGRIQMPKDYDEELGYQETGLDAAGMPVYATINGSSSSFSDSEVKLNITFQTYANKEFIKLNTNDEILANISWSEYATGTFYYSMFSNNDDGSLDPDPGYTMYVRDDDNSICKIADWLMGTDFSFTWNHTTNACAVLEQPIDYVYGDYGPMYIIEGAAYDSEKYGEHTSYYDPETKVFHFFPAYFVEAGSFGQVEELFEITAGGAVKHLATRSVAGTVAPAKVATKIVMPWNITKSKASAASRKFMKPGFSANTSLFR